MKNSFTTSLSTNDEVVSLFERIAHILESGRGRVLRTINHETVLAYWLIGREIVQALQGGEARAQYGNALIADLSECLTKYYGVGFSTANLKNFRQFYLTYADRTVSISHPSDSQLATADGSNPKGYPAGSESPSGFHPNLSWSHYRALMRVENIAARQYYETETVQSNWSRRTWSGRSAACFTNACWPAATKPPCSAATKPPCSNASDKKRCRLIRWICSKILMCWSFLFCRLPKVWRKRQDIQKQRVVSVGEIWRVLDKRMIPGGRGKT